MLLMLIPDEVLFQMTWSPFANPLSSALLSVSVLIFNTTSHCFVLVKQFRPGTFPTHKASTVQYRLFILVLVTVTDLDCCTSCGHFH